MQTLKQTLIDELQVLVGKQRTASITKLKGAPKTRRTLTGTKKKLTIEEEFLILQQLAALEV